MSNAIEKKPARTMEELLTSMQEPMAQALPRHVHPDRMLRLATTALRTTKDLAQCTPGSFLGAVMQAAVMGLEVGTPAGHAYLIPFRNKGTLECTLIIGYQGMMELARRSGHVRSIYAFAVYAGDEFSYELGLNPKLEHRPADKDKSDNAITHVYAVAKLTNGEPVFTVLTKKDVEYYRQKSKAKDSNFWRNNYCAMALKTAVRRLYTWLPRSSEMLVAHAIENRSESHMHALHATPEVVGLLTEHGIEVPSDEEQDPDPTPLAEPSQDGQRMKFGGTSSAHDRADAIT